VCNYLQLWERFWRS